MNKNKVMGVSESRHKLVWAKPFQHREKLHNFENIESSLYKNAPFPLYQITSTIRISAHMNLIKFLYFITRADFHPILPKLYFYAHSNPERKKLWK